MIKFYCSTCNKKIGAPENFAGKLVKCPRCAHPAQVPIPVTELASDTAGQLEGYDIESSGEGACSNNFFGAPELVCSGKSDNHLDNKCPQCNTIIRADSEFCTHCGRQLPTYPSAGDMIARSEAKLIKSVSVGTAFGKDLLSLMSPVKSLSDGIAFFILLLMHIFANIKLPIPVPFMGYAQLLVQGIICTFLFNVLLETANGNNHLPEFEIPHSSWDLVRPYFQLLVSGFYAFLPCLICLVTAIIFFGFAFLDAINPASEQTEDAFIEQEYVYEPEGSLPEKKEYFYAQDNTYSGQIADATFSAAATTFMILLFFLFCVGLFFCPMIILNIVLGDIFFVHPVKIAMNIRRTFKPYFICCLALFAAAGLTYLSVAKYNPAGLTGDNFSLTIGLAAAIVGSLCLEIYGMRVLGLLYRYHEDKLDW